MLQRCLDRDLKNRLRDIGEARVAISRYLADPMRDTEAAAQPALRRARVIPWAASLAVLAIVAASAGVGWWRATRPIEHPLMRFSDDVGAEIETGPSNGPAIALSPDGLRLAYVTRESDGKPSHLAVRMIGASKSAPLAGTDNAVTPFFSPDSRWIGFGAEGRLKKISVEGGAPVTLSEGAENLRGASWGEDGNILFSAQRTPLMRVPESGGKPAPATELRNGEVTNRCTGSSCQDGRPFFSARAATTTSGKDATVEETRFKDGTRKTLVKGGYFGRYGAVDADGGTPAVRQWRRGVRRAHEPRPPRADRSAVAGVLEDVAGRVQNGFPQFDVTPAGPSSTSPAPRRRRPIVPCTGSMEGSSTSSQAPRQPSPGTESGAVTGRDSHCRAHPRSRGI